jgi:unsaturated rhamnogalacturonyl hydrolase
MGTLPMFRSIAGTPSFRAGAWALAAGTLLAANCSAQTGSSSPQIADAILNAGQVDNASWNEDAGLQLEGLEAAWYNTANGDYFRFVKARVDAVLAANTSTGAIGTTASTLFARQLLLLYRVTLDPKYYKAAGAIRAQLADTCDAPSDSWNTTCTSEPFLAEYASVFQEPQEFANITRGFERWDRMAREGAAKTRRSQSSGADVPALAAALADALPFYPDDDPGHAKLIGMLGRIANASLNPKDPSERCVLAYAIAKSVRLSFLPADDSAIASQMAKAMASESVNPGAQLLAASELDLAPTASLSRGQTVLVDAWYNSQQRKNAAGQMESFHYKWSDMADSGYALFGHMFESYGAATGALQSAPTRETLDKAQYYIIASPDIPVKNPNPHYMTEGDADQIADWVKDGGVLIMMENDPPNADLSHLNLLADRFGIHFDDVLHHHILGELVEDGRIPVDGNGPLFHHAHTLYMKDTCAISLRTPGVALLRDRGDVVMASAKFGRGTVFAAVDPWLYNEYTDGRKKPSIYAQFDNFAGGRELVQWLLQQRPH